MIELGDAGEALDRRIAEALARWTGNLAEGPTFTRTGKGIAGLRLLMETSAGAEGSLRRILRDGVSVFAFSCRSPIDDRSIEGFGETGNLAICDAFLACEPDHFASPGPIGGPAPSAPGPRR